jgi:hypothetical protein
VDLRRGRGEARAFVADWVMIPRLSYFRRGHFPQLLRTATDLSWFIY